MNLQNPLDQFTGVGPGGVAAGGIMALLMSNQSARKFVGKPATYGDLPPLGGLACKACRNWQAASSAPAAALVESRPTGAAEEGDFTGEKVFTPDFQLTLIKAMIAAAKASGHIDAADQLELSTQLKGPVDSGAVPF